MSGGVGPTRNDISFPDDRQEAIDCDKQQASSSTATKRGSFPFHYLNSLAVVIVLAASGLVSVEDLGFVFFSIIYIYFISKIAFPLTHQPDDSQVIDATKTFQCYILTGALIGILLPILYILHGMFEGDKEGMKAAAPHLFLLAAQVFVEGISRYCGFSIPVALFVPVFYNSRRIFTLVAWLKTEVSKAGVDYSGSSRRLLMGRALAAVNLSFWCFNLFCFLIPVYAPKALKKYYSKVKQ